MADDAQWRFFATYTGVKLPLKLVGPVEPSEMKFRNIFFRAQVDGDERITLLEKVVHGEVHMTHRYEYYPGGALKRAEVTIDDETELREFPNPEG